MSEGLTDTHELQLQSFLRFSCLKRQQHQREILQCVNECAESSVSAGEMYSSSEVSAILDRLKQELGKYIKKEVENAYHSSALLVKLQLVEAQKAGAALIVDTNQLENETLLQQIRAREQASMSRPASDFAAKRAGLLSGLGGTGSVKTVVDPAVLQQRDRLRSEVEALQSRLQALQTAADATMGAKTDLARQLAQAQAAIAAKEAELVQLRSDVANYKAALDADNAAGTKAAAAQQAAAVQRQQAAAELEQQQLVELQELLKNKDAKVKAAEQALAGKLQQTPQWMQMRQLMQAKAQEVMQLRKQLAKYEAPDVPSADSTRQQATHSAGKEV